MVFEQLTHDNLPESMNIRREVMTQYIFLCRSRDDMAKVREVRGYLENRSFEPFLFNLKCLTDENETEGLLKRELDEGDWFAFIESPNALQSSRVRKERENNCWTLVGQQLLYLV